jgi:hypothetical protein
MSIPEHLMAIEYTVSFEFLSYRKDMVALFNATVISESEVRERIDRDFIAEDDPRIVVLTKEQYSNLFDKAETAEEANKRFYADLAMEQKETM